MKNKIIGVVIGQDSERTIKLALKSLKGCSKIYFIDGGSTDKTLEIAKPLCNKIYKIKFDTNNPAMPGIQKNFMLDKLKENGHLGDWIIHLDADELLEDNGIEILKEELQDKKFECYDIKMRHLIDNLLLEDATNNLHQTPTRVFKLTNKIFFPKVEHCVMHGINLDNVGFLTKPVVWHLAYCGGIFDVKKRYDGQMKRKTDIGSHNEEFLKKWKNAHLFNQYPKKQINIIDLPEILLNEFDIDKGEIYFAERGIEAKHFIEARIWKEYFKPATALCIGCGLGHRVFALDGYISDVKGVEINEWAVKNTPYKNLDIRQMDITKDFWKERDMELVVCYDILEHINYKDLDTAIINIIKSSSKYILISVPVIGDPNLLNDNTHKIFETKEWWVSQFTKQGLKLIKTPDNFPFKNQILLFDK